MYFDELNLNDNVLDALEDMHFDTCTPIQEKCIPEILDGNDVLGIAQTGTGKTAAYLLPVLSMLDDGYGFLPDGSQIDFPKDVVNCVIMAPTRELAQQIDQAMQGFSYYLKGVSSIAVYGGNDGNRYDQEYKSLTMGADVVIATPGRLISHLSLGNVDFSKVSFFILDEADRMLDMGFSEDILMIAKELPKTCQTIMFSATMPDKIEELAKTLLKNPVEVKIAVSKPAEKIQQKAYVCYETQKLGIIKDIFKAGDLKRVIIFSGKKTKVKQISTALIRQGINSGEMHSDLSQAQRDDMMFRFKSGQIDVLVATDILARGIDIDDIAMVINYDVPHDAEDYVHRIGRTARADRNGSAITFVNPEDINYFKQIEHFLGKEVEKVEVPETLGEAPEYKGKKGSSAKNRRKKDRDQNAHRRKPTNKTERKEKQAPANTSDQQKEQTEQKSQTSPKSQKSPKKPKHPKQPKQESPSQDAVKQQQPQPAQAEGVKKKKKRRKKHPRQTPESALPSTSSKYAVREDFALPKKTQQESGLKALVKKPLNWLKSFGRKK